MEIMEKIIEKEEEDLSLNIEYSFCSTLGYEEETRYIKKVKGKIFNGISGDNQNNELIGHVEFTVLLIVSAKSVRFDIAELFDSEEYTFRHGNAFYDFKNEKFKPEVYNHYDNEIFSLNLCFIEKILLKPAFRGRGLGPNVFKDLVQNFDYLASIFVIQPHPLQFDIGEDDKAMAEEYGLSQLEPNKSKAVKHLTAKYISWGFEKIKGIPDTLFFNSEVVNKRFDAIDMEDI